MPKTANRVVASSTQIVFRVPGGTRCGFRRPSTQQWDFFSGLLMFLQQLINGLTLGAVYALVALGYTMVYGILELINFAHGEIYMLGAYIGILSLGVMTVWGWTQTAPLLSIVAAVLVAAVYCGAVGATMERVAY
ncbi:MAG TPA: hypothetical protein VFN94_00550, partial [Nitrospiria bacterium]|nr:hypothetical protein [Nitrospiria bacterium]